MPWKNVVPKSQWYSKKWEKTFGLKIKLYRARIVSKITVPKFSSHRKWFHVKSRQKNSSISTLCVHLMTFFWIENWVLESNFPWWQSESYLTTFCVDSNTVWSSLSRKKSSRLPPYFSGVAHRNFTSLVCTALFRPDISIVWSGY